MDRFQPYSNKFIVLSLIILVGTVLNGYGQLAIADIKKATTQNLKAPAKTTKSISAKIMVPGLIGKTRAEAQRMLQKSALRLGKVQALTTVKGRPGTVAKQRPTANTSARKGSAVDIWIIVKQKPGQRVQSQIQPKPKFYTRNKKLFMEFSKTVHKIVVFNAKGNVIQRLNSGRRFDITKSLNKTKGGIIYLGIASKPSDPVPMRWDPRDRIPYDLGRYRLLARDRFVIEDSSTMGRSEPANDRIGGAPLLSVGYINGEVGGEDETDFGMVTALGDGTGTLVQIEVISGDVVLDLWNPTRRRLTGGAGVRKVWIALAPRTSFYFQVSPAGLTSGPYRVRISKNRLNDAYEANDSFAQARTFGSGQAFLGDVIDSGGFNVGFNDYYKINIDRPQNVQINVTNAGLASGERLTISLYDANGDHVDTESYAGTTSGCVFNHDLRIDWRDAGDWPPFPSGEWRILISDHGTNTSGSGAPSAYGTGTPPEAYTSTSGYSMSTTLTP